MSSSKQNLTVSLVMMPRKKLNVIYEMMVKSAQPQKQKCAQLN